MVFSDLKYISNDLKLLSASEEIEVNNVILQIKPNRFDVDFTYIINVNIKNYYDVELEKYININDVNIMTRSGNTNSIVEFLEANPKDINKAFETDNVIIMYHNYDIDYNAKLSRELDDLLQSTYETIYCTIHDL